jgi:Ca2+-binding EF-hand superfamily protein
VAILKFIGEACKEQKITPENLFKMADTDFSGQLTQDEMKNMLKKGLPYHAGALNFKKLLKALDQNGKG